MKHKNLCLIVFTVLLILAACTGDRQSIRLPTGSSPNTPGISSARLPTLTPSVTPISTPTITLTPVVRIVEVTRIVTRGYQIVVTPTPTLTPTPGPVQDCFDTAMTQGAMNECAGLAANLARIQLEETVSKITHISAEDKEALEQLLLDWSEQDYRDCKFFYGQVITDSSGILHYVNGSMAPMLSNLCVANQYEHRNQELIWAYFQ